MLFLILELLGIIYIIYRYKIAKELQLNFWGNPNFFLFFLSIFYVIHPCYFYYQEIFRLIIYDEKIITSIYYWCTYYYIIFFIFYILSTDKPLLFLDYKLVHISKLGNHLIIFILSVCFIILSIIILYGTRNINGGISRVEKYDVYEKIIKISGFSFLVWVVITWSFVMSMLSKKWYYLLFILPLVYLEFICSSRFYIFVFIIAALLFRINIIKKTINVLYFSIFSVFLFLIGILRETFSGINIISLYIMSFGEFINTWTSIGLILSDKIRLDASPGFVFVQRLIPEPFSGFIFGAKLNYTDKISDMHNFGFGLGSSVITEGVVYGTLFAILLPILIGLIYLGLNNYSKKNTISGMLICFFMIINTFSIFRGSSIINISSYIMIFFLIYKFPYFILKYFDLIKVEDMISECEE